MSPRSRARCTRSRCTGSASSPNATRPRPLPSSVNGYRSPRADMAVPQTIIKDSTDIASVVATLASRQNARPKTKPMSGPKRAAILMLTIGEQYGGKVWGLLQDDEVRELSLQMSTLGTVEADVVEDLLLEFVSRMSASGALMGTFD